LPHFPTYVLAAAALGFGIIDAIEEQYVEEVRHLRAQQWRDAPLPTIHERLDTMRKDDRRQRRRAERAVEDHIKDMVDVLGIERVSQTRGKSGSNTSDSQHDIGAVRGMQGLARFILMIL
jgi:hypothetical protein